MTQELEIEFKNLLSKKEYQTLIDDFKITEHDIFKQTNAYFDTPSFCIKANDAALRVREKNNTWTLTLKQKQEKGVLETHQPLNHHQYQYLLETGSIPNGKIKETLHSLCLEEKTFILNHLGDLTTYRAEKHYKEGLLVFDYSTYLGIDDYEVEYEVSDYDLGKTVFQNLLHTYKIPARETKNKIARLFEVIAKDKEG